ncbi:MAG: hypothetical protein M5U25_02700 [Planctomycetota bacterium]|nr:hypothetical protein [Planctomycetota bacterium]
MPKLTPNKGTWRSPRRPAARRIDPSPPKLITSRGGCFFEVVALIEVYDNVFQLTQQRLNLGNRVHHV